MTNLSTLKLPHYGCEVKIIITDVFLKEVNKLFKRYDKKERWTMEAEGCVLTDDLDIYYLVLNKTYLTYNTITHEAFHAAMKIAKDRGIHEEEAQAWIVGYVNEAIFKFLSRKKFTIKHG
jgi:hypothetical protein